MNKEEIICNNCGCSVADKSLIIRFYKNRVEKRVKELRSVNGIRGIIGQGKVLKILEEELINEKTH